MNQNNRDIETEKEDSNKKKWCSDQQVEMKRMKEKNKQGEKHKKKERKKRKEKRKTVKIYLEREKEREERRRKAKIWWSIYQNRERGNKKNNGEENVKYISRERETDRQTNRWGEGRERKKKAEIY